MTTNKYYFPHFAGLLREIAQQHGAELDIISQGWVKRLHHRGQTAYIWGYHWDLNPGAAQSICADKYATHEVLQREEIPHIPHALFMRPPENQLAPLWHAVEAYHRDTGWPLILKPVRGFGGDEVFFIDDWAALQQAMLALFQRHEALALAPYQAAPREIRAVALDGEILLCYTKQRPTVLGNGQDPLTTLLAAQSPGGLATLSEAFLRHQHPAGRDQIPDQGQTVVVDFRHNLSQGATPELLDAQQSAALAPRVLAVTQALGLRFCSVDFLWLDTGELLIMEINAGVMIERFIDLHPEGWQRARGVYEAAFCALFGLQNPTSIVESLEYPS